MNILQLSAHYHPNIGGVETHLTDLVSGLADRNHRVAVLTYKPLTTGEEAPFFEKRKNLVIYRIPWIRGFFFKLVNSPVLEFCYLFPGLFSIAPIVIVKRKIQVIHAHGLVAGFVGVFWGKLFGKRVIISTHSLYDFPKNGLYPLFVKLVFNWADMILCLSKKSVNEVTKLGVKPLKVKQFIYWVDLSLFKPNNQQKQKLRFGLQRKFVVLFVGRLIEEKGVKVLVNAFNDIGKGFQLVLAGDGPLRGFVIDSARENDLIRYVGKLDSGELVSYYNAADLLVVPSIHEEGFGRVVLESLACGTPVLASNLGSIPEAMDETVGQFISISKQSFSMNKRSFSMNKKELCQAIIYLKKHPNVLKKLSQNSRGFALKRYSERNIETIINTYGK